MAPQTGAPALEPAHFSAAWWRSRDAVSGHAPGRGESLFVRPGAESGEEWVLRHYRRGGLIAHLSEKRYVWCGERRSRPFAEYRLLAELAKQGLPVPAPVGACLWREGPLGLCYQAALLTRRIAGARALAAWLERRAGEQSAALLSACGAMIARFHRAGLDHIDLNARNILVDADEQPWLIDLDRCRLRPPGRWQQRNLERLKRSLEKFAPEQAATLMLHLVHGYQFGSGHQSG
ncbi:3-deoxy-D-manno-octulosonic acid kinase [Kushneria aurantia]|uniref:3-deoxy-D-manno-octulosonic acid kinase n=1 Tax=Kushneria aurantia TaxID=504092 RepID=A0ABV6G1J1_9GAMM